MPSIEMDGFVVGVTYLAPRIDVQASRNHWTPTPALSFGIRLHSGAGRRRAFRPAGCWDETITDSPFCRTSSSQHVGLAATSTAQWLVAVNVRERMRHETGEHRNEEPLPLTDRFTASGFFGAQALNGGAHIAD